MKLEDISIGPDLPGLNGVPEYVAPIMCSDCEVRAATVRHIPTGKKNARSDALFTVSFECGNCGISYQLETISYSVGLGVGVLVQIMKDSAK